MFPASIFPVIDFFWVLRFSFVLRNVFEPFKFRFDSKRVTKNFDQTERLHVPHAQNKTHSISRLHNENNHESVQSHNHLKTITVQLAASLFVFQSRPVDRAFCVASKTPDNPTTHTRHPHCRSRLCVSLRERERQRPRQRQTRRSTEEHTNQRGRASARARTRVRVCVLVRVRMRAREKLTTHGERVIEGDRERQKPRLAEREAEECVCARARVCLSLCLSPSLPLFHSHVRKC